MENFNRESFTQNKGVAAATTPPKKLTTRQNFTDNSAHNQRLKLLDWFFEKGSITTSQAREHLDVMSPAPRILELRKAGYQIATVLDDWISEYGIKHRIARYVLVQKESVESEV